MDVDLGALAGNVRRIAALVAPAELCAVVKADAYGHGDVPVAETALEAGASRLAVALVEEGIRLREAGIDAPILVLSEPPVSAVTDLVAWDLTATVYRASFLSALAEATTGTAEVHVKVDTGMHRVGADPGTALALVREIDRDPRLVLGGVWSHLAVADTDAEFTHRQIELFDRVCGAVEEAGVEIRRRHLANTPGAILYPDARYEMVRVGLGIYGLHPCPATRDHIELEPVMSIVSQVAYVRRLPAGSRPSYGRRRPLGGDHFVATVPVGYADGVPRAWSDDGVVLVGARRRPFAGVVTMDQVVVDVGEDQVEEGDEVVLLGRQGGVEVTADEWAEATGTINYEIVSRIGPRLPRRYRR